VKKWMMWRVLLALVFLFLPLIGPATGKQALARQGLGRQGLANQEPTNLLQNPGFEGNYFPWSGINEVQVAHNWTPWWRKRSDADPPATYFQPEYKQANGYIYPNRVHGGAAAQQWFTFYATHQAGMYQQVFNVTPGARYRFTVWAQVWSSTDDDANSSVNPAYPNLRVGIDPTGNWNPWDGDIVWSGAYAFYDSWGQLAVEAVAQNDVITVFMRSEPNIPVKHNDMYWDDAALVAVGADVPPPAPPAQPTATSAGPPPVTPTCAPAPADWVTYSVQRGDTLFSLARNSGTTLDVVVSVNCLGSTTIHVGQALLLPRLPDTATPAQATSTAVPATATSRPTATAVMAPTATATVPWTSTPTQAAATLAPTDLPATYTATPAPVAAATATPTRPNPTIPPPSTPTPGSPTPAATPTPLGESTRPCGTIAVGAGIVLVAGGFRWRKRGRAA
jgi:LysM repeat protein